jgi:hypothetical protein
VCTSVCVCVLSRRRRRTCDASSQAALLYLAHEPLEQLPVANQRLLAADLALAALAGDKVGGVCTCSLVCAVERGEAVTCARA